MIIWCLLRWISIDSDVVIVTAVANGNLFFFCFFLPSVIFRHYQPFPRFSILKIIFSISSSPIHHFLLRLPLQFSSFFSLIFRSLFSFLYFPFSPIRFIPFFLSCIFPFPSLCPICSFFFCFCLFLVLFYHNIFSISLFLFPPYEPFFVHVFIFLFLFLFPHHFSIQCFFLHHHSPISPPLSPFFLFLSRFFFTSFISF